jgi:hypothetical protein
MKFQVLLITSLTVLAFAGEYTDEVKDDIKAGLKECLAEYKDWFESEEGEPTEKELMEAEDTLDDCIDTIYDAYGAEAESYLKSCIKEAASAYEEPDDEDEISEEDVDEAVEVAESIVDECLDSYYESTKSSSFLQSWF